MPKKTRTTRTRKSSTSSTRGTTSRKTPSAKRGVSSTKPGKTRAPIKTTQESHSGRNQRFKTAGGRNLSRAQLVSPEEKIRESFEEKMREVFASLTPAQHEVASDQLQRHNAKRARQGMWIHQLRELTDALSAHGLDLPWPAFDSFWLRLHGVLTEVFKRHRRVKAPESHPHHPWHQPVLDAMDALRNELSDKEVIFAYWCRQRAAHVYLDGLGLNLKGDDNVRRSRPLDLLGRDLSIEELDDAIAETLAQTETPATIAVRLAKRIQPTARELADAYSTWENLTDEEVVHSLARSRFSAEP